MRYKIYCANDCTLTILVRFTLFKSNVMLLISGSLWVAVMKTNTQTDRRTEDNKVSSFVDLLIGAFFAVVASRVRWVTRFYREVINVKVVLRRNIHWISLIMITTSCMVTQQFGFVVSFPAQLATVRDTTKSCLWAVNNYDVARTFCYLTSTHWNKTRADITMCIYNHV